MLYSPWGGLESAMPVLVGVVFVIVIGMFIVRTVQGIGQWNRNNASPVLTVDARLITKRADVSHHQHHDDGTNHMHHTSYTTYYATFEVQSGDRLEFVVSGREYGQFAQQDTGKLTFQGTRYIGFERDA